MIRVVMFDLGMTLIDADRRPFPHVETALAAISDFKTADGKALRSCLVSDFRMAAPPVTAAKVTALFNEYLSILTATGLRPFFEPVAERVTLSTHAGVNKPDQEIFEKALQRLGADVSLEECLLITEETAHIEKARSDLGMKALRFGGPGSDPLDFDDWAEAPALVADLVAPDQPVNTQAAIKAHLAGKGIEMLAAEPAESSDTMTFSGQVWSPISVPGFEDLQEVHVAIPVKGKVTRGPKGKVRSVAPKRPSAEEVAEATSFVRSLAAHDQIAGQRGKPATGATHQIETDKKGRRRLVRKRFTAV
jgi:beta-phosphoglucomutase-like phosphatase (HAD superfamily)